jgi:hypothetical protein
VYDVDLSEGRMALPVLPKNALTGLLYVYQGAVEVSKNIMLQKRLLPTLITANGMAMLIRNMKEGLHKVLNRSPFHG